MYDLSFMNAIRLRQSKVLNKVLSILMVSLNELLGGCLNDVKLILIDKEPDSPVYGRFVVDVLLRKTIRVAISGQTSILDIINTVLHEAIHAFQYHHSEAGGITSSWKLFTIDKIGAEEFNKKLAERADSLLHSYSHSSLFIEADARIFADTFDEVVIKLIPIKTLKQMNRELETVFTKKNGDRDRLLLDYFERFDYERKFSKKFLKDSAELLKWRDDWKLKNPDMTLIEKEFLRILRKNKISC